MIFKYDNLSYWTFYKGHHLSLIIWILPPYVFVYRLGYRKLIIQQNYKNYVKKN